MSDLVFLQQAIISTSVKIGVGTTKIVLSVTSIVFAQQKVLLTSVNFGSQLSTCISSYFQKIIYKLCQIQ